MECLNKSSTIPPSVMGPEMKEGLSAGLEGIGGFIVGVGKAVGSLAVMPYGS